jgi:hypothetical protein
MNFARYRRYNLTRVNSGNGKDIETWEAASGALGVQADCAMPKLSSMHQSIEFRIVNNQYFNNNNYLTT